MGITYQQAGVDINAGNKLIGRIREVLQRSRRREIINDVGGFASLSTLPSKYKNPVLVTSTDGVGTKLELAGSFDHHHTIGQDLVAMCVNDVLVYGAEPLLFLDYFATGKLDVDLAEKVITGIAEGCIEAGCALAGGETAEMPGFYPTGKYDLAGFCVGVVERQQIEERVAVGVGDILVGIASDGPHSNGYSLIRKLLSEQGRENLLSQDVLNELLAPTRIYVKSVLPISQHATGMAHITGGAFIENLPRMLPNGLAVDIALQSWNWKNSFRWIQEQGRIDRYEMLRTFNCGIGFVMAFRAESAESYMDKLRAAGEIVYEIGRVVDEGTNPEKDHVVISEDQCDFG